MRMLWVAFESPKLLVVGSIPTSSATEYEKDTLSPGASPDSGWQSLVNLGIRVILRGNYWQLRVTVNHLPCRFDSYLKSHTMSAGTHTGL